MRARIVNIVLSAVLWMVLSTPALAQSGCNTIVTGAVLTAAQWNACFAGKQDYLGYVPLNPSNLIGTPPIVVSSSGATISISAPTVVVGTGPSVVGQFAVFNNTTATGVSNFNLLGTPNTFGPVQTFNNGVIITPPAASIVQGFNIQQSGPTSGNQNQQTAFNYIGVLGEQVDSGSYFNTVNALYIKHEFGGPNASGARASLQIDLILNAPTSQTSNHHNSNYVTTYFNADANSGDGGTDTGAGAKGILTAANFAVRAKPGALYLAGLNGMEIDVVASEVVRDIIGASFVRWGAAQAVGRDVAIAIYNSGAVGDKSWKDGIVLTNNGFGAPLTATGSVIRGDTTQTAANFASFPAWTFSNKLFDFMNFSVSGAGVGASASWTITQTAPNLGLTVQDGTVQGAVAMGGFFTHSMQVGTGSTHNLVLMTNFTPAAYIDTSQQFNFGVIGISRAVAIWNGFTSGAVAIKVQDVAGNYNFQLPTSAGLAGQPLLSGGGGLAPQIYDTLGVGGGGTGLTVGTSGGIPYFSGTTTIASSAVLTANALVLGGGAGAAPASLGSLGATTTVLHGNASGPPTFGAVSLTADVSGALPAANGGTGQSIYAKGDLLAAAAATTLNKLAVGTDGQVLTADAASTNGVKWAAVAVGEITLTNGHILVGNVSNVAADVAMSGDISTTNAGVTAIGATKVTSAMLNADVFSTAHSWGIQTFTTPVFTGLPTGTGVATANTVSTLVARDGSGNFAAGTITAALSGNATTSTTLATTRAIYGNNFDGSAALTQIIASTYGGTGNGFTKFSGPTTSEKTFTLPNANGTLATLAGTEAFTNKTYNGNTWTAGSGVLTIGAGKTLTVSNTLTFTGTDGSSVNFQGGGVINYGNGTNTWSGPNSWITTTSFANLVTGAPTLGTDPGSFSILDKVFGNFGLYIGDYNTGAVWLQSMQIGGGAYPIVLQPVGGGVQIGGSTSLTLAAGEFALLKGTASGSAPGASGLKFAVVCGTNAGSAKVITYAGTSTTPVTIVDNVGSGVTGC